MAVETLVRHEQDIAAQAELTRRIQADLLRGTTFVLPEDTPTGLVVVYQKDKLLIPDTSLNFSVECVPSVNERVGDQWVLNAGLATADIMTEQGKSADEMRAQYAQQRAGHTAEAAWNLEGARIHTRKALILGRDHARSVLDTNPHVLRGTSVKMRDVQSLGLQVPIFQPVRIPRRP